MVKKDNKMVFHLKIKTTMLLQEDSRERFYSNAVNNDTYQDKSL